MHSINCVSEVRPDVLVAERGEKEEEEEKNNMSEATSKVRGTTSVSIKITFTSLAEIGLLVLASGGFFGWCLVGASAAHRRQMPHGSADK